MNDGYCISDNIDFLVNNGIYDDDRVQSWPNKSSNHVVKKSEDNECPGYKNIYRRFGYLNAALDPLSDKSHTKTSHFNDMKKDEDLEKIYCGNFSADFMHISDLIRKDWMQDKMESRRSEFSLDKKKKSLSLLMKTTEFERFLHKTYQGAKRFSMEGGESSVLVLRNIIEYSSMNFGVDYFSLGMPHRGRLGIMTGIFNKPYANMLYEFEGKVPFEDELNIAGDVKYHMGFSHDENIDGKNVHLSLASNPSHLEAINTVIMGKVRSQQDLSQDLERKKSMGILMHGDASFAGQGIVYEALAMSGLSGYNCGGIIHIIVNNQIGFTTDCTDARCTHYSSSVAKAFDIPILYVNGDHPEDAIYAAQLASEYRNKFGLDIIIEVICYRKYGHNEGDAPDFTQPLMYKKIQDKKSTYEIYYEKLLKDNFISSEEFSKKREDFIQHLESERDRVKELSPKVDWLRGNWNKIEHTNNKNFQYDFRDEKTGVDEKKLFELGEKLFDIPNDFNAHPRLSKILEHRKDIIKSKNGLDWGSAEALAFASILDQGSNIRLSGEDSKRGTFAHRHSVLFDYENNEEYTPLQNLSDEQGKFEVINSNLSEYGVMGFEYGYSLNDPHTLVLWEGQFGDFANGAQITIDQFIASGESKWMRMNGLVLLLPHGYEGQGPEHSSARMERFLQLCGQDQYNMNVIYPSTPANYFHALRKQIMRNIRKPLIIFTPKSLLRRKEAVSSFSDMNSESHFQYIIDDDIKNKSFARKVILCTGKIYYDLCIEREKREIKDVAFVRIEKLFPFPRDILKKCLFQYKNAEVFWCQEETKNAGAWSFVEPIIGGEILNKRLNYIGRPSWASPCTGYMSVHTDQQSDIIAQALS